MPFIKLKPSDDDIMEVDSDIAMKSVTIRTIVENFMDEVSDGVIPLPNITTATLKMVIEWCTYHKDEPPPPDHIRTKDTMKIDLCPWDTQFLKVDRNTLFGLLMAANYLDIGGLSHTACKMVASKIAGKSTEEIREIFNIKNDRTANEQEQDKLVQEENKPCEEKREEKSKSVVSPHFKTLPIATRQYD